MSVISIEGPCRLRGELRVQGAKNSTLPLLAAAVVCKGKTVLHSCPQLSDVDAAVKILETMGCSCQREGDSLIVDSTVITACEVPHDLMREMRSSIVFLGAIIARVGEAKLSFPGGCELGARPIDLHLSSLRRMGVQIDESHGCLHCTAPQGIVGDYIHLSFPSVGATENIILAAVLAKGTTVVENAAREPEIMDLAAYLNKCGAKIYGAGDSSIVIEGVEELTGTEHTVMPDRIVAATYMAAAAVTGGELLLKNTPDLSLKSMLAVFEETGCRLICDSGNLYLCAPERLKALGRVRTMP
ncbi:MAG: UDP-N-acetylglucosamine 1-carboxyvinyltransferase, partial [Oscillospiraceae bacterium]